MTIITQDTSKRTAKTIGEVIAVLAAVQVVLPQAPSTATSAVIAGGSGVVALVLNMALDWFTNTKSARLDKLAAAIDAAVDARLEKQGIEPAKIPAV